MKMMVKSKFILKEKINLFLDTFKTKKKKKKKNVYIKKPTILQI